MVALSVLAATVGVVPGLTGTASAAPGHRGPYVVYVHAAGHGTGDGTRSSPYTSLAVARNAIRPRLAAMRSDVIVELESGTYTLTKPFVLTVADSGRNGHHVIYETAPGAHPVVSGGFRVTGWHRQRGSGDIWVARVPKWLDTRQLYVDGRRAQVAQGTLPVTLTQIATGYAASSTALDDWSNPTEIEMVYPSGPSNWTETRCRVASIAGTTVTMAQPCWDNSTLRPTPGTSLYTSGFGMPLTVAPVVTNAYPLLTKPGQWYLDDRSDRLYYMPEAGQDMKTATVIAPRLQTLVEGAGTATAPVHNVEFKGIAFSYATWLEPSGPDGYSDFQTGTFLTGTDAYRLQGACDSPQSSCPYAAYTQMPGNVTFRDDRRLVFEDDTFTHLGAVGLALGDGSEDDLVQGSLFTDTSGGGLSLGGVDQPLAAGSQLTSENRVLDSYFHDVAVEYQDCAAIFVGYAQYTTIEHNQIDDVPYSGISIGWGGWRERFSDLSTLSNYSQGNVIANNLIFDQMQVLVDGGGIYTNGIEGSSIANAELIEGNVVLSQHHPSWAIYTDNGTEFVRVSDNVVLDALYVPIAPSYLPGVSPYWSFGGCGGGPIDYDGDYSVQTDPSAGLLSANAICGGHSLQGVTVEANHVISALNQVPQTLLSNAGIGESYKATLSPAPTPTTVPAYFEYSPF
jgi:hypothetical protein